MKNESNDPCAGKFASRRTVRAALSEGRPVLVLGRLSDDDLGDDELLIDSTPLRLVRTRRSWSELLRQAETPEVVRVAAEPIELLAAGAFAEPARDPHNVLFSGGALEFRRLRLSAEEARQLGSRNAIRMLAVDGAVDVQLLENEPGEKEQ